MAALLLFLKGVPWKLLGYGAAALAVIYAGYRFYIWIGDIQVERDKAVSDAQSWERVAGESKAALDAVRVSSAENLAAVSKANEAALRRLEKSIGLLKDIDNAPRTTSCLDAPVVQLTLQRLREQLGRDPGSTEVPEAGNPR